MWGRNVLSPVKGFFVTVVECLRWEIEVEKKGISRKRGRGSIERRGQARSHLDGGSRIETFVFGGDRRKKNVRK